MKKRNYTFLLLIIFFVSITDSFSYPRFAAYTGNKCVDCHINPAGGSMRNLYGIKYAKENLSMDVFKDISNKTEFSGQLTKNISIGGDVRLAHVDNQNHNAANMNTFLSMQGDLYVNAKVNDYIDVFVSPGISIPNIPMKYDVYGMVSKLPLNSYFKVGRFTPDFGIKIVEHRAFQRNLILNTPYSQDEGLELGISPGIFNLSLGLFNGLNTDFFDADQNKMFVASTGVTLSTKDENINFNLGASFLNNPFEFHDPNIQHPLNSNRKVFGGHTMVGIYNKVALLGEYDLEEYSIESNMTRREYRYIELNGRIIKGVELRGAYEFYDINRDITDDETTRFSVGAAVFPLLGFEFEAMMRFVKFKDIKTNEIQGNFHFYF